MFCCSDCQYTLSLPGNFGNFAIACLHVGLLVVFLFSSFLASLSIGYLFKGLFVGCRVVLTFAAQGGNMVK